MLQEEIFGWLGTDTGLYVQGQGINIHVCILVLTVMLQVKIDSIAAISIFEKKGFLTVSLIIEDVCKKRMLIRKAEGLREWFNIIKVGQILS